MLLTKGVIRGGQVVVSEPINLPDGSVVTIRESRLVDNDDEQPDSPEEIAADIARMQAFEALDMTDAELAIWEAERQTKKAWEKAHFFARVEQLRRNADAEIPPG
jgi:hypothetical protein